MGRIPLSSSGTSDYFVELARGNIAGQTGVSQYGNNDTITTQEADIWDAGRDVVGDRIFDYPFLDSPEIIDFTSTSANDTLGGTGARTLLVEGLNAGFEEVTEIITLGGLAIRSTTVPDSFVRINNVTVLTAGSSGFNEGKITAVSQSSGLRIAQKNIGTNKSFMAIYTVPVDHRGVIIRYYGSVNRKQASAIDIALMTRPSEGVFSTAHMLGANSAGTSYFIHNFIIPIIVPPKTDIKLTGRVPSATVDVSGGFDLIKVKV